MHGSGPAEEIGVETKRSQAAGSVVISRDLGRLETGIGPYGLAVKCGCKSSARCQKSFSPAASFCRYIENAGLRGVSVVYCKQWCIRPVKRKTSVPARRSVAVASQSHAIVREPESSITPIAFSPPISTPLEVNVTDLAFATGSAKG